MIFLFAATKTKTKQVGGVAKMSYYDKSKKQLLADLINAVGRIESYNDGDLLSTLGDIHTSLCYLTAAMERAAAANEAMVTLVTRAFPPLPAAVAVSDDKKKGKKKKQPVKRQREEEEQE
jgi:hypothetical protein